MPYTPAPDTSPNYRAMIEMLVKTEFEQASAGFLKNTNGDNWRRLQDAMWALQGILYLTSAQIDNLKDMGIGRISQAVAELHKSKDVMP